MADKIEQLKQKQASPFVFQVNSGEGDGQKAIHTYVLPLNPENYQITHSPRATHSYTQ